MKPSTYIPPKTKTMIMGMYCVEKANECLLWHCFILYGLLEKTLAEPRAVGPKFLADIGNIPEYV